ncbi:hypothetical protein JAAARDRAFT_40478 [Jaapia argillacea MUCL 33604]|uniref:Uncharacterized protein n=1 Tax=Jaapia argillacea MUCL 33604 TaxID=933084 RepID=A0A067PE51_9AGAM|nr:hypothetical protein JAAARDRAFT_40478 [Jaapia argillacea MUCL 33604]
MDPLPVIHLTDFTITLSRGGRSSPPSLDDAQIFLQLTLDSDVIYETVLGEREPNKQVWRVQDCIDIPDWDDISLFSIAVILSSASNITTRLTSVGLTSQDIPAKGRTSRIVQLSFGISRDLPGLALDFSVNRGSDAPGSPFLPISADCEPTAVNGIPNTDIHNTQVSLYDDERISPSPIEELSPEVFDGIYASTLVEPDVEERAVMLDELGDMLLMHY